jgi:arsenite-transporting ATPase
VLPWNNRGVRIELYGGKGGVGKTTCAAARAVRACDEGERVLVVSTDPAHSLGDALTARLGPRPTALRVGRRTMHALELDADRALERWMRARSGAFRAIAERGTYLDDEDVDRLMGLSLPGVDELVGLLELKRIASAQRWDRVIVDAAPTGHMLRLLETPEALARVANVLDEMQAKHRLLAESLAGAYRPDATDETIVEIDEEARELRAMLRDGARCEVTWVLLPEAMAVAETTDALKSLEEMGIQVGRLLVNRVTPRPLAPCTQCTPRVRAEKAAIAATRRRFRGRVEVVPVASEEPRGVGALRRLGGPDAASAAVAVAGTPRATTRPRRGADLSAIVSGTTRLLFFGGKGGVGKTTCATATAVALASEKRRVLLLSTDPAHSVSDALGARVGDATTAVPGAPGLHARELDARAAFVTERERYRDAIEDVFRSLVRDTRLDASYDRAVMEDLVDLAPPGIDEALAVVTLVEELAGAGRSRWDTIVVDTAPTGHTLRLLAMPAAARAWVHAILGILLKYRRVLGLGELASDLVRLGRRLGELHELLRDPEVTAFVVVTRAAELPRLETERLLAALARAGVPVPAVVVDAVTAGDCPRCRRDAARESRELAVLARSGPARASRSSRTARRAILLAPAVHPPPRGVASLARWAHRWTRYDPE